jgi:hypothetical protein
MWCAIRGTERGCIPCPYVRGCCGTDGLLGDLLGVLEVGGLGDVVVLSDAYFAVADEDLKSLHSVLTVLGGRVVHSGGINYWA